MKCNRGISMITLIVTIIVMIIFLGLTYRIGSRYLSQSREQERASLVTIMSSAVERRQNDNYLDISGEKAYYSGYHLPSAIFDKIAEKFNMDDSVYEPGLWYVIDGKHAEDLGIVDANKYLVSDLKNPSEGDGKYIVVADYYTGKVIILNVDDVDELDDVEWNDITTSDHDHQYTVATCTEPSVCKICGEVSAPALGHDINPPEATCTEDAKCSRCGYIAQKALGHSYGDELVNTDPSGHYNECVRCGDKGNFEKHTLVVTYHSGSEWKHNIECEVCGYSGIEDCNKEVRKKDKTYHTIYCSDCGRSEDVLHDDPPKYREIDQNKHMVYCDTCKTDLYEEEHEDVESPYGVCDKCNALLDTSKKPEVSLAVMENKTVHGIDKYWGKKGDTIEITMVCNMVLSGKPIVKIQGITLDDSCIVNDPSDPTKWIITFLLNDDYPFTNGPLTLEITNIRSMWGQEGEPVTRTTNDKYVTFDKVLPKYIYLP